jgi:GNAT superfamily N-acetyltransferase
VVDAWWGGRHVSHLLPRLFFEHFSTTSFVLVEGDEVLAFLVGFRSQSLPRVAYIHFVGVAPDRRGVGHGRLLYERFFAQAASLGCTEVRCITSPANAGSIAFHRRMGFDLVDAGGEHDGIPVSPDHAGPGQARVLFRRLLAHGDAGR